MSRLPDAERKDAGSRTPLLEPWPLYTGTKLIPDNEYIDLETIDISEFDLSSVQCQAKSDDIIKRTMSSLKTTGFIAVKGHGLSHNQLCRQFALGKLLIDDVPDEEKKRLHASIEKGSWAGYKPQGYYKRPNGTYDTTENYDLYPYTALASRLPEAAKPYLTDIRRFIEHNHYHILSTILAIISLGLGLEVDTLWKLHHRGGSHEVDSALQGKPNEKIEWKHTKDHLRYIMYHPPIEEERERKKGLWLSGHTDLGSVTFLYSQPTLLFRKNVVANEEWSHGAQTEMTRDRHMA